MNSAAGPAGRPGDSLKASRVAARAKETEQGQGQW